MSRRFVAVVGLASLFLGWVALTAGCSSTHAEPLAVTYYYLPG